MQQSDGADWRKLSHVTVVTKTIDYSSFSATWQQSAVSVGMLTDADVVVKVGRCVDVHSTYLVSMTLTAVDKQCVTTAVITQCGSQLGTRGD